jgi:UDP-glucose 4-epimerase
MKQVLITGGAGSVGQELTRALVELGHQVRVFDLPTCDFGPLQPLGGTEIVKGDITNAEIVQAAVKGVDIVLHLAALLPPLSERSRERTFAVNVGGTRNIVEAIRQNGNRARLVFASSVATYGNTTAGMPPITVDDPQGFVDIYGESKIEADRVILTSGIPYTILRISGIVIPALLDPPDPWPFMRYQRMEFINRADVVTALLASVERDKAIDKIFNIAGGESWQMLGHKYVEKTFQLMDIPIEDAKYRDTPGWCDWYDTAESQAVLGYQQTSFPQFLQSLEQAIAEALA